MLRAAEYIEDTQASKVADRTPGHPNRPRAMEHHSLHRTRMLNNSRVLNVSPEAAGDKMGGGQAGETP